MSPSGLVSFGDLLKQLRKRAGMTQADLAVAVGYSIPFISNLELNQRLPDVPVVAQHFVPALGLQAEPHLAARLVELAAAARGERRSATLTLQRKTHLVIEEEREAPPLSMPAPPTELIGREQDIKTLCNRLLTHSGRLLTLIGPPGIGKTRLALAVAGKLQGVYPDGVYFAPLAAISDAELVAATLVSTLGISDSDRRPPNLRLIEFLRRKEVLLLLDNFEQITPAASLVAELLAACPGLRVLVTSRERLHLRAEQRYRVPPLTPQSAVLLFVRRAQALDAEFAQTPENQTILTAICQHLDCLPLAIELSAARVDLFSPEQLLARLRDQRLDLLTDGPQDLPVRQRTLRNAIRWSYELLDERDRQLFRTLGVFVGGFGQDVLANLGVDEWALQSLINKSMVQVAIHKDGSRRFLLLETLREYAWEQLCDQGEAATTQRLHAEAYLRLAEQAASHLRSADQAIWLERLAVEHDNLRAAIAWSLASQQVEIGVRLGITLWRFWNVRGYYEEGWGWLEKLLVLADQPEQRANLLYGQGMMARRRGDTATAADSFVASLALFRALGDRRGVASALRGLGFVYFLQDKNAAARPLFEEALALFRALGDLEGIAVTLDNLAYISNDPMEEQRLYQESLALSRRSGNLRGITTSLAGLAFEALGRADYATVRAYLQEQVQINQVLNNQSGLSSAFNLLGLLSYAEGDYSTAQMNFEKGLKLDQETGDRLQLPDSTLGLGMTMLKRGEYDHARLLFEQALIIYQKKGQLLATTRALGYFAAWAVAQDQAWRALCLAGVATALGESQHIQHLPLDQLEFKRTEAAARQWLSEEAAAAAWAAGQAMTLEQAVAYALTQSDHDKVTN
jgi:predicted ATPase/transcriptional regulator with XRE-family HTH domain